MSIQLVGPGDGAAVPMSHRGRESSLPGAVRGNVHIEDLERLRQEALERAEREFRARGELCAASATLHVLDGNRIEMMMPGLSGTQQRSVISARAGQEGVWLVHHLQEIWWVSVPSDPIAALRAQQAYANGTLDQHPDRQEALILWEECDRVPIRRWHAEITRQPARAPNLGPWVESTLSLPRPSFKRYLPEAGLRRPSRRQEHRA